MILRTFYAITNAFRHHSQLKQYIVDPKLQLKNVTELTANTLRALGINALVLDFDGVLAAHGEPIPRSEVMTWLHQIANDFGQQHIFILSNKPTLERQEFFKQNFPQMDFIIAKRKKPYPDGLQQIIAITKLPANQLLLVDDRLGTGILATIMSGTKAFFVTEPYINLGARPVTETGFIALRAIEKTLLSI